MKLKSIFFTMLTMFLAVACNSKNTEQVLSPEAFNDKIKQTPNAIVLDVRTPGEFAEGYLDKAINIDINGSNFESEISKLDKNKTYFVYCLSGKRSASAASYMRSNGFTSVINLDGGILAWQAKKLPIVQTSASATPDKISMDAYQKLITSDTLVLVDYYAPWCAPCMKMKPMLEQLEKEYAGKVKVVRLNIDENKALTQTLNIEAIPIVKTFLKGKEIWTHKGYIEKDELVKQLK